MSGNNFTRMLIELHGLLQADGVEEADLNGEFGKRKVTPKFTVRDHIQMLTQAGMITRDHGRIRFRRTEPALATHA